MTDELRDSIGAAFEKHASAEPVSPPASQTGGPTPDAAEPVRTSTTTEISPDTVTPPTTPAPSEEGRVRGPDGKFLPKDAAPVLASDAPAAKSPEVTADSTAQQAEVVRPPQSWTPAEREVWGKVPAEAQRAIQRREQEIQRGLSQAAGFRKFTSDFQKVVQPFESIIRAQNSNPLQAIHNLMSTAAGLYTGNQQQKAAIVRDIINNYAVDIKTLDEVLTNSPAQPTNPLIPEIQRMLDSRLAPVNQLLEGVNRRRAEGTQQVEAQVSEEIVSFGQDPKNEFFEDLREDMADLMDLAAARNRKMTMQEAYERAAAAHPQISQIMRQRQMAQTQNADAARAASSSIRPGGPASVGGVPGSKGDLRADLSAAFDQASR